MSFKTNLLNHLEELSDLMDFNKENKFKVAAFKNGANIIRRAEGDVESRIIDESLFELKGIGKGLKSVILEFYETGASMEYKTQKSDVPDGIMELMNIRGLGARKVRQLYDELKIQNLEELESACRENKIADLKGFGAKTADSVLREVERLKKGSGYVLLNYALKEGEIILEKLSALKTTNEIVFTGELRRTREIISKIEILVLTESSQLLKEELANIYKYNELEYSSSSKILQLGCDLKVPVLVYLAENKNDFLRTLFITTGSDEFFEKLGKLENTSSFSKEEDVFEAINFPYVIPEMREKNFFDLKDEKSINSDLEPAKFKGLLHFHTNYSDGSFSLEEMVGYASKKGFEYFVVCDHSKSAFYANGLKEDRVLEQNEEIKKVSSKLGLKIFQGIESDIVLDGNLDYENDFFSNFHFVVASIHSGFNLSEKDMTARIIKAVENENTDLLAHPTGRLLLSRDPYNVDIKKVIEACSRNNVAIEINANPNRLDLDWRNVYYAREIGCKFSINADAHSLAGIDETYFGMKIARKAGVQSSEVINCFSLEDFTRFINRKVKRT